MVLKATVNCDMGEGFSLYSMGDDAALMPLIHLANVACGFHASDFTVMSETVQLAKTHGVRVGSHPSLPDRQGFGRREMKMTPQEFADCITYQTGALYGFLKTHGMEMSHIKPHGSAYGMCARDPELAKAAVGVAKIFGVAFMGLAGTQHEVAAKELGVPFLAEWFADMEYTPEGQLIITKKHDPVPADEVRRRVIKCLIDGQVTTTNGFVPLGDDLSEVTICVHSDTPGAEDIAKIVKSLVDEINTTGKASTA
ncbi:LamB/YcsF family protein [Stereum hirsutum FP-91666 SS1]|uniref:LamB/YcsF family protein n=1 Tax=Stereum hirsutum (strain FP-91666) TaxID=721885 RepID=UPI0004449BD1|nr:LamB/YcsF family protein [Stereum hirsutum FP-91666 SS1]EIM84665.1 LamB/YcsF family protein [Stereum hirsutum FP-91666 SS1]